FDRAGRRVAAADDRPDDWNFLISQRLAPGRYRLEVDPVGAAKAQPQVSMRLPAEVVGKPFDLSGKKPFAGAIEVGGDVGLHPLTMPAKADLLVVAARAHESLGLSVEAQNGNGWTTVATRLAREPRLAVALPPATTGRPAYRLRLWSLDRQGAPVEVTAAAVAASRLGERELAKGAALVPVAGVEPPTAAAVVDLARPGLFRLAGTDAVLLGTGGAGQALLPLASPAGSGVFAAPGGRLWLVQDGRGGRVRAERATAASNLAKPLQFALPPGGLPAVSDLPAGKDDGPVLALATALSGQPGVRVGERDGALAPEATTMAVGPRAALAVTLQAKSPAALVWQADAPVSESSGPSAAAPPEVRLASLRFAPPKAETAGFGTHDGTLSGVAAARFDLPSGAKNVRLSLGEATVAVLSDGDRVLSTHWHGGAPFEELTDATATRLTLLHARAGADPYTVELLPQAAGEEVLALSAEAPFERSEDRAGTLRLTLPDRKGGTPEPLAVHVRSAGRDDASLALLDSGGGVARGRDVAVLHGGTLLVEHGPGLLLVWLAKATEKGDETGALWPADAAGGSATRVTAPATVPLSGRFAHLALAVQSPVVLHLRTAAPLLSLLRRADGSSDV
ncbi:MAG TPA: hypothetical protein VGE98_08025, partial [Thermoanaerobaculia bacterium]